MTLPTKPYTINRYDSSNDKSLRAHSAADEYLLRGFKELNTIPTSIAIYNDRFGFLSCHLHEYQPSIILIKKSQQKAIDLNHRKNNLPEAHYASPLSSLKTKTQLALLKAPKSLALFELYLQHIVQNSTEEPTVLVAFMTRHFSPNLIKIAEKYFEVVVQSKAVKKARLATLTIKKEVDRAPLIDHITFKDHVYKQYWGVFSAKHIDYATQYFLEHLEVEPTDQCILDLGSGNGVIAKEISNKLPEAQIHLLDDAILAVESAKLNIEGANIHHHFENDLSSFGEATFDLIVSNPPFHFEYEISIQIPIQLFRECHRCLKINGNLQIVANKHLNYLTHLKAIFSNVNILSQNEKFVIYKCVK